MSATKRAREEQVERTTTHDDTTPPTSVGKFNPLRMLLQQLIEADPDKLIIEAEQHALLSRLENFINKLHSSIDGVKKVRSEEEASRLANTKVIQNQKEIERSRMAATSVCFKCKKLAVAVSDVLYPCAGFKEEGVSGDGIIVCEGCRDNQKILNMCPHCDTFLCEYDSCCDPSYKCEGCEKVVCLPCAEKIEYSGGSCECSWYCAECFDDKVDEDICCRCNETNIVCGKCDQVRKCEGGCKQPLCDDCASGLACGNDAHLCGVCNFDCPDCDICEKYCGDDLRWE